MANENNGGWTTAIETCPFCDGTGWIRPYPALKTNSVDLMECNVCGGKGRVPVIKQRSSTGDSEATS